MAIVLRPGTCLAVVLACLSCLAGGCRSPTAPGDRGDLTVGVGAYDVGFFHPHNRMTVGTLVEYRAPPRWKVVRPIVGVQLDTNRVFYGYAGAMADFHLGRRLRFGPSFAVGGWIQGDGKDLGFPIEFRTGFEVGYAFENGMRMGIGTYHVSHANLGDRNRGAESILFNVSTPVEALGIR